jgi:hypothetical protein
MTPPRVVTTDPAIVRLTYTSRATRPLGQPMLHEMLRRSRMNNARIGLTGVLLYRDEQFLQVLEGPADGVLTLFDRIRRDDRHHHVRQLRCERVAARLFGGWAMGFEPEADLPQDVRGGFTDYLDRPEAMPQLRSDRGGVNALLGAFRRRGGDAGRCAWTELTATV